MLLVEYFATHANCCNGRVILPHVVEAIRQVSMRVYVCRSIFAELLKFLCSKSKLLLAIQLHRRVLLLWGAGPIGWCHFRRRDLGFLGRFSCCCVFWRRRITRGRCCRRLLSLLSLSQHQYRWHPIWYRFWYQLQYPPSTCSQFVQSFSAGAGSGVSAANAACIEDTCQDDTAQNCCADCNLLINSPSCHFEFPVQLPQSNFSAPFRLS